MTKLNAKLLQSQTKLLWHFGMSQNFDLENGFQHFFSPLVLVNVALIAAQERLMNHQPFKQHWQPHPQGLLLIQNGSRRNPGQGCRSGSKSSLEFRHANTMKCIRFVWTTVSDCRKQTGPPDTGNNVRKSHFIVCHVTKYSTIRGVFQQPWPGVSPTNILNEGKALGTRLQHWVRGVGKESICDLLSVSMQGNWQICTLILLVSQLALSKIVFLNLQFYFKWGNVNLILTDTPCKY